MTDQAAREIIEHYIAACNAFDVAGTRARLSPDVRFENDSAGVLIASTHGVDAFRRVAEQSESMSPLRGQRVTSMRIEDGSVFAQIAYRDELAVDIPKGPAAGTLVELDGSSELSIAGGLIRTIVDRR